MEVLYFLETIRTSFGDKIMQLITLFGQEELILALVCLLFWCLHKNLAYQIAFTFFASGLMVQTLKITFRVPRPWVLDPDFHAVPSAVPAATGYSFPSGHTQGAVSLYGSLILRVYKRWQKVVCAVLFLLVGFSRLYLGVHTPKDVLVSTAISLICAWIFYRFMMKFRQQHHHDRLIALLLGVVSVAVAGYALFLLNQGILDMKYANDCCKAAGAGIGFAIGWYLERTFIRFSTVTKTRTGQFVKFLIGIIVLLVLKSGIKVIFGEGILINMLRYMVLVLWIIVLYPLLIKWKTGRSNLQKENFY